MTKRRQEAMVADMAARDASGRRHVFWLTLLVMVWSLELLALQEFTSAPGDGLSTQLAIKYAARRMVLNVSACVFLACVLNRFWLYLTFGVGFLVSNVLVVYATYFGAPLSWTTIRHQWQEGLAVTDHGMSLIRWSILLLLLVAVVFRVVLRERLHRHLDPRLRLSGVGWTAAAVYFVFAIGLAGYHKPISQLKFGSPEFTYGYVVAWVAEGLFFDEKEILRSAMEAARERSDRLSPRETPLAFGSRISIVQVESLDWDVIDAQVQREWVMPFLHDLRTRSMSYVIRPIHETGTSDADFALLTGTKPNGKIAPFMVRDYPYQNTLPLLARQRGYSCLALHGNEGTFFERRPAYEKMGFAGIFFEEELRKLECEMSGGGITDEALFRLSAQWMRQTRQPTIHFIITFTSHGPFNRLPADKKELFPEPADQREAYLNSMRYVDRALESYLQALPEGTTLVLYGDHGSGVSGYSALQGSGERVPWLIYCKGQNLAQWQRTRDSQLAQSGELQLLDLTTYLHGNLNRDWDTAWSSSLARQEATVPAIVDTVDRKVPPVVAASPNDPIRRR